MTGGAGRVRSAGEGHAWACAPRPRPLSRGWEGERPWRGGVVPAIIGQGCGRGHRPLPHLPCPGSEGPELPALTHPRAESGPRTDGGGGAHARRGGASAKCHGERREAPARSRAGRWGSGSPDWAAERDAGNSARQGPAGPVPLLPEPWHPGETPPFSAEAGARTCATAPYSTPPPCTRLRQGASRNSHPSEMAWLRGSLGWVATVPGEGKGGVGKLKRRKIRGVCTRARPGQTPRSVPRKGRAPLSPGNEGFRGCVPARRTFLWPSVCSPVEWGVRPLPGTARWWTRAASPPPHLSTIRRRGRGHSRGPLAEGGSRGAGKARGVGRQAFISPEARPAAPAPPGKLRSGVPRGRASYMGLSLCSAGVRAWLSLGGEPRPPAQARGR